MEALQELYVNCPFCGETVSVLWDATGGEGEYVEDCEVCCRPMALEFRLSPDGDCAVDARREEGA